MPDVHFARGLMRGFVESRPGLSVKQKIGIAARQLRWSFSRARSVFYGEARRIDAAEMETLRKAAGLGAQIEDIADEREELAARLGRMEAMLAAVLATVRRGPAAGAGLVVRAGRRAAGAGSGGRA